MNINLFSKPILTAFDSEGEGTNLDTAAADAAAAAASGGTTGKTKQPAVFTQDDINRFLAEDRRKHGEKLKEFEVAYKASTEKQSLSEQEKTQLQEQFDLFKAEFRTKEEVLASEKAKLEKDLKTQVTSLTGERDTWKNRYESTEIRRAITDAANAGEAYRAEHVLAILQPMTKMTPVLTSDGKPTGELAPRVHYTVVDPKTSEYQEKVFTAQDAVAFMKSKPEEFGHLFRASATGGLGGSSGTGTGQSGKKVDLAKLSPAEFRKLRKENPAAIYGR